MHVVARITVLALVHADRLAGDLLREGSATAHRASLTVDPHDSMEMLLLVLPGFGYGPRGQDALGSLAPFWTGSIHCGFAAKVFFPLTRFFCAVAATLTAGPRRGVTNAFGSTYKFPSLHNMPNTKLSPYNVAALSSCWGLLLRFPCCGM